MCLKCLREAKKIQKRCNRMLRDLKEDTRKTPIGFVDSWIKSEERKVIEECKKTAHDEEVYWLKLMN